MAKPDVDITEAARRAAMMAVLSAGDPYDKMWRRRVQAAVPTFAALVRDDFGYWGTEAQGIIDAQVFTATYTGHDYEETSTRLIVHLDSPRAEGGSESIRTERTDTPPGAVMAVRIRGLAPGTEIAVFKKIEDIGPTRKARVLVHFEPLPSKSSAAPNPTGSGHRPQAPEYRRSDEAGDPSPSGSSTPSGGGVTPVPPLPDTFDPGVDDTEVQRRLAPLSATQRLAVKNRCVGEGLHDWVDPGPEHLDRVLAIIKEIAS